MRCTIDYVMRQYSPGPLDIDRVRRDSPRFADLYEDIKRNGVQEPITVDENGVIVDGLHRILCCYLLGKNDELEVNLL